MKKIIFALLLLTAPVFLMVGSPAAAGKTGKVETIPLTVKGMTCAMCKYPIKNALKKLDGVVDADVSYKDGKATVKYDPEKVTPQQMVDAVKKAGYTAYPPKK